MGTLTGGEPVLASYCVHKLPSSCRLSSIDECCACYDERGHSASYSTYIDGIGFVLRGTRWQRYCWFCKEFWQNRVEASGLRNAQTRIPEVPDVTEFLDRWYEFHQGYRIVKRDDGSEERIALLGEDFKDVSPGCLPRTLEEMRAGRERSEMEERERERARARAREQQANEQVAEEGPSLDQTLDQLFEAAAAEERPARPSGDSTAEQQVHVPHTQPRPSNAHAQSMVAAGSRNREYQARRVAALRRELHRMRSGIERVVSGLRDLGEGVPDHTEASYQLSDLGRTLDSIAGVPSQEEAQRAIDSVNTLASNIPMTQNYRTLASIQSRVDEARQHVDEARRSRDQAAGEMDLAEQELRRSQSRLRQVQNEQRTTENYMRTFGTREEVAAQGENYESPIGGMFDRAIERFRAAEEVRREERTLRQVLTEEARSGGEVAVARLMELEQQERDVWGVPRTLGADGRSIARSRQEATGNMIGIYPRSDIGSREEGHELEEYYSLLLQRQERVAEPEQETSTDIANGLAAGDAPMTAMRRRRHQQDPSHSRNEVSEGEAGRLNEPAAEHTIERETVAGPPGQQLDDNPLINNDRGLDAVFVLSALSNPENLRSSVLELSSFQELDPIMVAYLLTQLHTNTLNSSSRETMESAMSDVDLIWGVGLPAERNRRRRERGERITFTTDAFDLISSGLIIVHDVEVMAEAFQMSAQLRRMSGLSAPEQLAMLYRLQRGDRTESDRRTLLLMLGHEPTFDFARHIHEQDPNDLTTDERSRRAALEGERRDAARRGDHSRSELDAQRRATMNVALAAGRVAMNAGPTALLEQVASRDAQTRTAYERLQQNGFVPAETMSSRRFRNSIRDVQRPNNNDGRPAAAMTESDEESDGEHHGLDAKDSGRPEQPMTDEQMTLKLECQVCYSQLATIAMLPCGHLTMCQWCSDQHSPTMAHDRTRPRRHAACPVCRKTIRQKVKVFRS